MTFFVIVKTGNITYIFIVSTDCMSFIGYKSSTRCINCINTYTLGRVFSSYIINASSGGRAVIFLSLFLLLVRVLLLFLFFLSLFIGNLTIFRT